MTADRLDRKGVYNLYPPLPSRIARIHPLS